jgi:hypothetical protein
VGEPVLCYVDGPWAWFTTSSIDKQWGDDWNDAPYQANAGDPYPWRPEYGVPEYRLQVVAWSGPFEAPYDYTNLSVEDINAGLAPWLRSSPWVDKKVAIPAGVTLREFKKRLVASGGKVYMEAVT